MEHGKFNEWLKLSFYKELGEKEEKLLRKHLRSCPVCSMELNGLKKMQGMLAHRSSLKTENRILQDARRRLRLKILAHSERKSVWNRFSETLDGILSPRLQTAFGIAAILAFGFFAGYLIFNSSDEGPAGFQQASYGSSIEVGKPHVTNIRFLERDVQSGIIEFTFESVSPVHIQGNVDDENIQKILARALVSDQNTGNRLRAVNLIGSQTEQNQNSASGLNAEVRSSLISALLYDRNLGVKRQALDVLKNYLPDTSIVRAFLKLLRHEKNAGLKIAAINSLDLSKHENQPMSRDILEMLKEKAQSDDNNYIRIKAKAALQEVQQ